ncbi:MAG TPA: hypothetical protein DIV39_07655 [Verrucomicrobiales bacterium]|nr:hypothetical protein [Verrucomicrobiales bacterium]
MPSYRILFIGSAMALSSFALGEPRWRQSYHAGHLDQSGAYAGGSEIMHLVAHQGKMYAANGYWVDARWVIPPEGQRQSAQVLRLDKAAGEWQVDLDTGKSNGMGLEYMKGNVLKSVTFTRNKDGGLLANPHKLLVMAAGANFEKGGAVSVWVRDDEKGAWIHTLVRHGSSAGGIRWVPRDMEVHRDQVSGEERLFLSLGNPGIISGIYDESLPGKIRWERHLEHPFLSEGSFRTRPLGIARANKALFFSEGGAIYQRIDGEPAHYRVILDLHEDTDTDVGGIRGLSAVRNPRGDGESLLFLWAPGARSASQVKRLDPDGKGGFTMHDEANIMKLMSEKLGVEVTYTLGAHNMMYPVADPETGEIVHIIGFQGNIRGKNELRWKGSALYGGAMYAVRRGDLSYALHEINNEYKSGKPILVSPRAFCLSPFSDRAMYVGGHDASRKISDDMAWIFEAPLDVVLGQAKGRDANLIEQGSLRSPRLTAGPLHELRIYSAAEGRHGDLIKRFKDHTDRIFRRHGLEALGYWIPTEGPAKKRRRLVYLLKHGSRYDAYRNWVNFSNDREWEKVLDKPEFQGLLAKRPESVFLNEETFSRLQEVAIKQPGGVYELRSYVGAPGDGGALRAWFRENLRSLFRKHGARELGAWVPFDEPGSADTMVSLLHHRNREQADIVWKEIRSDPLWGQVLGEVNVKGNVLAAEPEVIFLRALGFSPLR